jgi:hypothetical protein
MGEGEIDDDEEGRDEEEQVALRKSSMAVGVMG